MMLGIAAGGVLLCCMTGGIKEPRPRVRVDLAFDASSYTAAVTRVAPGAPLPRLVVFDLDNTLWTPELYTLRYLQEEQTPMAGDDVWMLSGAAPALHEIATRDEWRGTQFAIASRQDKTAWARDLLEQFRVPMPGTEGGPPLSSLFQYIELRTGTKKAHFRAFHEASGIPYEEMLFFDDARGGKFGNCEEVSSLGVLSYHCPDGLTPELWTAGVTAYSSMKAAGEPNGRVLPELRRDDRIGDPDDELEGTVTRWIAEKRYGFVRTAVRREGGNSFFFHRRALKPAGWTPARGDKVTAVLGRDLQGRIECQSVILRKDDADGSSDHGDPKQAGGGGAGRPGAVESSEL